MKRYKQIGDYGTRQWAIRVSAGFRDFGFDVTPDEVLEILKQIAAGTHNQSDPVAIMIADGQKRSKP